MPVFRPFATMPSRGDGVKRRIHRVPGEVKVPFPKVLPSAGGPDGFEHGPLTELPLGAAPDTVAGEPSLSASRSSHSNLFALPFTDPLPSRSSTTQRRSPRWCSRRESHAHR